MASIQISIADPCHENWNDMLPEEKGRFCLSCQKTVVDFTSMSDGQVFDYFKNYKGSTCGQFTPEQLNRDIPKPKTHSIGRWKYFWQILLPAIFALHKAEAQTLKGKVAPKTVCKVDTAKPENITMGIIAMPANYREPKYNLQGTIVDEKQQPIPYATIAYTSGKGTVADSSGHFSIELVPGKYLTISRVGYETKTFFYDSIIPAAIKEIEVDKKANSISIEETIELKQAAIKPEEVVVVGYGTTKGRVVSGGMTTVYRTSLFQKETKPVMDLPALKIFPNPIRPGQSFQVNLQTRKTGNYLLKITDATGKTMLEEKLSILNNNQTETINGNALQQTGIYFLQISNPADKVEREMNGRIVVQ